LRGVNMRPSVNPPIDACMGLGSPRPLGFWIGTATHAAVGECLNFERLRSSLFFKSPGASRRLFVWGSRVLPGPPVHRAARAARDFAS
jgi:hypothetical protein